jgi:hypothetical protein
MEYSKEKINEDQIIINKQVLLYYINHGVKSITSKNTKFERIQEPLTSARSNEQGNESNTDNSDGDLGLNKENTNILNYSNNPNDFKPIKVREVKILERCNYKYIGETINNKQDGFGISEYTDNSSYTGTFKRGKKSGYGKTVFSDGVINIGELLYDLYNGYCESYNPLFDVTVKGMVYKGKFIDEVIIENRISIIEGIRLSDFISQNDRIEPCISSCNQYCNIYYSENKIFKGEVNCTTNELVNAYGLSVIKGMHAYFGQIKDLKMEGYGELYFPDSSRFYGTFKENKKNGLGITVFSDKTYLIGKYQMDVKDGPFLQFTKNNAKMELYLSGFRAKTLERYDTIIRYLHKNYPEYTFIARNELKKMAQKLVDLDDYNDIIQQITLPANLDKGTPKFKCKTDL